MSNETEHLSVKCPLCQQEHRYRLAIDRSHVLYNMTSDTLGSKKQAFKRFRRIFTCPTKGEHFQATIKLEEAYGTVLNDVKVFPDDIT